MKKYNKCIWVSSCKWNMASSDPQDLTVVLMSTLFSTSSVYSVPVSLRRCVVASNDLHNLVMALISQGLVLEQGYEEV